MKKRTFNRSNFSSLSKITSVGKIRNQLKNRYLAFTSEKLSSVLVLGAADEGRRLVRLCKQNGIKVIGWFDDDPKKTNSKTIFRSKMLRRFDRKIPVLIASHRILGATNFLRKLGFKNTAPFALMQILYPKKFIPHMFYKNWIEDLVKHKKAYKAFFSLLKDSSSKQVLNKLIQFRLTLDPFIIEPVIDKDLYQPQGILSFRNNEIYVDGGSYDGDSVRLFIRRAKNKYDKILAFVPDKVIYRKLVQKMNDKGRIECLNQGLFNKNGKVSFSTTSDRASLIESGGTSSINVASIDSVLNGERVSFIKMNIEGAEINALKGAQKSIKQWFPKMAISCYHRPSDLWQIPLLINKMSKKYNLYLRQHDGGVIESVCYAIHQNY